MVLAGAMGRSAKRVKTKICNSVRRESNEKCSTKMFDKNLMVIIKFLLKCFRKYYGE